MVVTESAASDRLEDSATSPSPPAPYKSLSRKSRMSRARMCADSSAETETSRGWDLPYLPPVSLNLRSQSALRLDCSADNSRILRVCSRMARRRFDASSRNDGRENDGLESGRGPEPSEGTLRSPCASPSAVNKASVKIYDHRGKSAYGRHGLGRSQRISWLLHAAAYAEPAGP